MPRVSFVGQRADKFTVTGVDSIQEYENEEGIRTKGVVKKIDHYTISCDECGGDGFYDQRGDVVCEGCGMVLVGDPAPVFMDASGSRGYADEGNNISNTRGPQGPLG